MSNAYEILKNEPDGWAKAWEVTLSGKHVAFFRWRDDAEAFIEGLPVVG